jgi:1-acyl-sn-glycerol-3-phosphate acyltransferase
VISLLKNIGVFIWLCIAYFLGTVISVLRWGDPNNVRATMRLFAWGALPIAGIRVELEGAEHMETHQPCIYVSNHQHGIDMATFGRVFPHRTVIIGKKELIYIPFVGMFFVAAGNILIDRKNRTKAVKSLAAAARRIKTQGISVGVFPEGTRNRSGKGMLPFKKGGFHLAAAAGVPIVPLVCSPLTAVIDWEKKRFKGGLVILRALPPIRIEESGKKDLDPLVQEIRELMLKHYAELGAKVGAP